jgi:hypothetical protein
MSWGASVGRDTTAVTLQLLGGISRMGLSHRSAAVGRLIGEWDEPSQRSPFSPPRTLAAELVFITLIQHGLYEISNQTD